MTFSFIFVQALVELLSEGDIARRATFPEKADIRWGSLFITDQSDRDHHGFSGYHDHHDYHDDDTWIREIGVHLAAKVFEEAVREKSSMVAIWIYCIIVLLIPFLCIIKKSTPIFNVHLCLVQHMNKEMYEHFQYGGMEELKSYIRSNTFPSQIFGNIVCCSMRETFEEIHHTPASSSQLSPLSSPLVFQGKNVVPQLSANGASGVKLKF